MRILLTGASGLLGGELAGLFAEHGHSVVGLAHRKQALVRNDGRALTSAPWRTVPPAPGQIAILTGDVTRPALGLDAAACRALAASLDLIVHGAAMTKFGLDRSTYGAVNVGGTANILALAAGSPGAPVPVLHVSTAYVSGERSGPVSENELDVGQTFANGYEESKAAAEQLVGAARQRGVPIAVARPSIVVGAARDGVMRAFDNIYLLLRLIAQGRIRAMPAACDATLDLVPVDYVTSAILDIAERIDAAAGLNFHLTSGAPFDLHTISETLAEYPAFHQPRFVMRERFDGADLSPVEQRVAQLYASYLSRNPRFRVDNSAALLGRTCPALGKPFLRRLIDHCIRVGFLAPGGKGATVQRTSG